MSEDFKRKKKSIFIFLQDFIYLVLEKGREGERESNIHV